MLGSRQDETRGRSLKINIVSSKWLLRPVGRKTRAADSFESGHLDSEDLEVQKSGNPSIWKSRNLEFQKKSTYIVQNEHPSRPTILERS